MERVSTIIDRLKDINNAPGKKGAIDIDLMLDYVRVLYVDLLEERKKYPEPVVLHIYEEPSKMPPPTEVKPVVAQEPTSEVMEQDEPATDVGSNAEPEAAIEYGVEEANTTLPEEVTPPEETIEERGEEEETILDLEEEAQTALVVEANHVEAVEADEPLITLNPEKEEIEIVQKNAGLGISFEPPPPAVTPEIKATIEEPIAETTEIAEIVEELPVVETPLPEVVSTPIPLAPEIEPLPEHTTEAVPTLQYVPTKSFRDIRTFIGINDKYLFLNELFNNNKTNYEETLDTLNKTGAAQEASDWLKQQAVNFKWEQEDVTVQSFYALVSKYFSER